MQDSEAFFRVKLLTRVLRAWNGARNKAGDMNNTNGFEVECRGEKKGGDGQEKRINVLKPLSTGVDENTFPWLLFQRQCEEQGMELAILYSSNKLVTKYVLLCPRVDFPLTLSVFSP